MELLQDLSRWSSVIVLVLQAIFGVVLLVLSKRFTTREDCSANHARAEEVFAQLKKVLDGMEHRQTEAEARLDNLPPLATVHSIELTVAELRGEMRAQGADIRNMGGMMKGIERDLNRLTDAHMKE